MTEPCPSCHGQQSKPAAIHTRDNDILSPARVASMAKALLVAGVAVLGWLIYRYSEVTSPEDSEVPNEWCVPETGAGDFYMWEPES
jgi:hypothetical protein